MIRVASGQPQLISSRATLYFKWVAPTVWLLWVAAIAVSSAWFNGLWGMLIVCGAMALVAGFVFGMESWRLADEVHDAGDVLIVRKGRRKLRVPLRSIVQVDCSRLGRPTTLTLWLEVPDAFAQRIVFVPNGPAPLLFGRHRLAEQLLSRIRHIQAVRMHAAAMKLDAVEPIAS